MNIIDFIADKQMLNDKSLSLAQKMSLKAVYGLALTDAEMAVFRQTTGLDTYELREWGEATFILGRRSGT